jgi:hypothetical protein
LDAAVGFDPSREEAWRAIEALAFARGDTAREVRAQAALAQIDQADPALGQAAEWIVLGQHDRAEALLKPICQSRPGNHWRAFERHLAPLTDRLGDALETWRE